MRTSRLALLLRLPGLHFAAQVMVAFVILTIAPAWASTPSNTKARRATSVPVISNWPTPPPQELKSLYHQQHQDILRLQQWQRLQPYNRERPSPDQTYKSGLFRKLAVLDMVTGRLVPVVGSLQNGQGLFGRPDQDANLPLPAQLLSDIELQAPTATSLDQPHWFYVVTDNRNQVLQLLAPTGTALKDIPGIQSLLTSPSLPPSRLAAPVNQEFIGLVNLRQNDPAVIMLPSEVGVNPHTVHIAARILDPILALPKAQRDNLALVTGINNGHRQVLSRLLIPINAITDNTAYITHDHNYSFATNWPPRQLNKADALTSAPSTSELPQPLISQLQSPPVARLHSLDLVLELETQQGDLIHHRLAGLPVPEEDGMSGHLQQGIELNFRQLLQLSTSPLLYGNTTLQIREEVVRYPRGVARQMVYTHSLGTASLQQLLEKHADENIDIDALLNSPFDIASNPRLSRIGLPLRVPVEDLAKPIPARLLKSSTRRYQREKFTYSQGVEFTGRNTKADNLDRRQPLSSRLVSWEQIRQATDAGQSYNANSLAIQEQQRQADKDRDLARVSVPVAASYRPEALAVANQPQTVKIHNNSNRNFLSMADLLRQQDREEAERDIERRARRDRPSPASDNYSGGGGSGGGGFDGDVPAQQSIADPAADARMAARLQGIPRAEVAFGWLKDHLLSAPVSALVLAILGKNMLDLYRNWSKLPGPREILINKAARVMGTAAPPFHHEALEQLVMGTPEHLLPLWGPESLNLWVSQASDLWCSRHLCNARQIPEVFLHNILAPVSSTATAMKGELRLRISGAYPSIDTPWHRAVIMRRDGQPASLDFDPVTGQQWLAELDDKGMLASASSTGALLHFPAKIMRHSFLETPHTTPAHNRYRELYDQDSVGAVVDVTNQYRPTISYPLEKQRYGVYICTTVDGDNWKAIDISGEEPALYGVPALVAYAHKASNGMCIKSSMDKWLAVIQSDGSARVLNPTDERRYPVRLTPGGIFSGTDAPLNSETCEVEFWHNRSWHSSHTSDDSAGTIRVQLPVDALYRIRCHGETATFTLGPDMTALSVWSWPASRFSGEQLPASP